MCVPNSKHKNGPIIKKRGQTDLKDFFFKLDGHEFNMPKGFSTCITFNQRDKFNLSLKKLSKEIKNNENISTNDKNSFERKP